MSGGTATAWPVTCGRLFTPATGNVIQTDRVWALDNGAFSGFDAAAFLRVLDKARGLPGCRFVAAPDVVGDWAATIRLFRSWSPVIRAHALPVAVVGQDGVTVDTVPWQEIDAVFLGGSTAWKLGTVAANLAAYGRALGKWVHMGRVNTRQRYRYAAEIGCQSVDGTFFSRWPDHAARTLARWVDHFERQPRLIDCVGLRNV